MWNYQRPLRSDELQHFKYIKRERRGDHWIYFYPDGSASENTKRGTTSTKTYEGKNYQGRNSIITETTTIRTNRNHLFTTRSSMETTNGSLADRKTTVEYGRIRSDMNNTRIKVSQIGNDAKKRGYDILNKLFRRR